MTLKKFLKENLIRIAHSREYELIPSWSMGNLPLVRHLKAVFAKYEIDCVFDVGGNLGQYHDLLRDDVGFTGWIYSFEPVKKYIDILNKRAASELKWRIFDFALGSAATTAEIHVTKSPGLNSFLEPRKDIVQEFWQNDAILGTELVQIQPLDDIYKDLQKNANFCSPYLKLDTQGFDLEVLKGASNSLKAFRAMQTEAAIRPLYQGMPSYQEAIDFLSRAGFDLSGMFPVTHDDALRLIEFDCVMINRLSVAENGQGLS